ncbi:MAG: hypothetical protein ACRD3Q_19440, partial [Terriglobales bacterium]
PGCSVNKSGSASGRVNDYFNTDCFTSPPVIGDDGVATAFGNAPIGNIHGPGQFVSDMSLSKAIPIKWPSEAAQLTFRSDVFNVFNHPVFADPSTDFEPGGAAGFIGGTASNPRVIQVALKFIF